MTARGDDDNASVNSGVFAQLSAGQRQATMFDLDQLEPLDKPNPNAPEPNFDTNIQREKTRAPNKDDSDSEDSMYNFKTGERGEHGEIEDNDDDEAENKESGGKQSSASRQKVPKSARSVKVEPDGTAVEDLETDEKQTHEHGLAADSDYDSQNSRHGTPTQREEIPMRPRPIIREPRAPAAIVHEYHDNDPRLDNETIQLVEEVKQQSYFGVAAVATIFCGPIFGTIALCCSVQSSRAAASGDLVTARRKAMQAIAFSAVSLTLSLIFVIGLIMYLMGYRIA